MLGIGQQQLYLLLGRRASRGGEGREDGKTVDAIWPAKKPHMLQLHGAFFHNLHPHNAYSKTKCARWLHVQHQNI